MLTTPQLFALANGIQLRPGPHRCWHCGAACDDTHRSADWVKGNCTTHQYAAAPSSGYVCGGCVATLNERARITVYGDGVRERQKVRNYSWLVSRTICVAYTKAHVEALQAVALAPPPVTPYALALSTSGQRHLLYLARPVTDPSRPHAQLDDEEIPYTPTTLRARLSLTETVCAATGRLALTERPSFAIYRGLHALLPDGAGVAMADEWSRVWSDPLSRLAAWLTPRKEICLERLDPERTARAHA